MHASKHSWFNWEWFVTKKTSSTGITDSQLTDDSHFDSIYYPDLDSEMDSELETKADTTDLLPTEQMTK